MIASYTKYLERIAGRLWHIANNSELEERDNCGPGSVGLLKSEVLSMVTLCTRAG